jgi:effector-binding domain-containing protein
MKIQEMRLGFGRALVHSCLFAAALLLSAAPILAASEALADPVAHQFAQAQTTTPPAPKPVEVAPAAPATPASPSTASPTVVAPSSASPTVAAPATPAAQAPVPSAEPDPKAGGAGVPGLLDDTTTQTLDIPSRPTAILHAKSDWESGFKSIHTALDTIEKEVAKAGLKQGGKPIAVFVETSESGFTFDAMLPLAEVPEGKDKLGSDVTIGKSPAGKAIKFEHRGAYDDIDSTYDLITAYLDEKGLEAQNLFIEEYLTDTKNSDDQALEVDIYVFIK